MKQLIRILPWTVTSTTLEELGKQYPRPESVFDKLPEWCLRSQEPRIGKPIIARYYHQFTPYCTPDQEQTYFFFSIEPISTNIEEEINMMGMEQFLEEFNFLKLFKEIYVNSWSKVCLPKETLLVFDLEYTGWGEDFDLNIVPLGYLNDNLELNILNMCQIETDIENESNN